MNRITLHDLTRPMADRARERRVCGPYVWTPPHAATCEGFGFYMARGALEMARHGSIARLRLEEANDHLRGPLARTLGYHLDPWGDGDTAQPIVARLPRGRGYLAGFTLGLGMCASLSREVHDCPTEAARAAHEEARIAAEREREEREREDLEEWEDLEAA